MKRIDKCYYFTEENYKKLKVFSVLNDKKVNECFEDIIDYYKDKDNIELDKDFVCRKSITLVISPLTIDLINKKYDEIKIKQNLQGQKKSALVNAMILNYIEKHQ